MIAPQDTEHSRHPKNMQFLKAQVKQCIISNVPSMLFRRAEERKNFLQLIYPREQPPETIQYFSELRSEMLLQMWNELFRQSHTEMKYGSAR